MRKYLLTCSAFVLAASALIAGCGDNRDDLEPYEPPVEADFISGVVEAPSGVVAQLQPTPLLRLLTDWIIPPAYAALIGIEPVEGATVELLQIDDAGNPIDDVIDEAETDSNGAFSMILPEGFELVPGGDLIVRVSGGGTELRGQVVRGRADINPFTEFLLRRLISGGEDLSELDNTSIAGIYTFIDDYEIPVGVNVEDTISQLEIEVGTLLDEQIEIMKAVRANGGDVIDSYRLSEFRWALIGDDDADHTIEQFSKTVWDSQWNIADDTISEDAFVQIQPASQSTAFAQLFTDNQLAYRSNETALSGSNGSLFSSNNVLYTQATFTQSLNGDYRRDTQPVVVQYQFSSDLNAFAFPSQTDSENFRIIDDNDEVIDPVEEAGDEKTRGIVLATRVPSDAANSDVSGLFGRVAIATDMANDGEVSVALTTDEMNFDSIDSVTYTSGTRQSITRDGAGGASYANNPFTDTNGSYALDETGNVTLRNTEEPTGYVNAAFDFYGAMLSDSTDDGANEDPVILTTTQEIQWAVKRPSAMLDITNKSYRLFFTNLAMTSDAIGLQSTPFTSVLDVNSPTTGTLNSSAESLDQAARNAGITRSETDLVDTAVTYSLSATGEISLSFADGSGNSYDFDGFLNTSGTVAVLGSTYTSSGAGNPSQLGLAVLIEMP